MLKNNHSRKAIAVLMTLVMSFTMVFATAATAFAAESDTITVTVKLDTRSYDLNAQMLTKNNQQLAAEPVVTYENVTLPAGSTALQALEAVAEEHNFDVDVRTFNDGKDKAVQQIAKVGEQSFVDKWGQALYDTTFVTLPDASKPDTNYSVSGWIYGITPVNSTEFFPYDYMNAYTMSDGMVLTMHYSVTGPYDYNIKTWTTDYSNPDVTMWGLYDQVTEKIATATDPDAAAYAEYVQSTIHDEIEASAKAKDNTSELTAYYFSHNGLTNDGQLIPTLKDLLSGL